jgi:hypothetical protein
MGMDDDAYRAITLVTDMMRDYPELFAARGKAFCAEFYTGIDGQMRMMIDPVDVQVVDDITRS